MKISKKAIVVIAILLIANVAVYFYTAHQSYGGSGLMSVDNSTASLTSLDENRVSLTVPSDYVYGASQDDLDTACQAAGYESITLNEDGTATYVMTKEQHEQMLADLATGINSALEELPGSDGYSDIASVVADEDFTHYTITTTNTSADFDTSMVVIVLKMYSTMYYAFDGVSDKVIHYDFYNKNNEEIATLDSNISSSN